MVYSHRPSLQALFNARSFVWRGVLMPSERGRRLLPLWSPRGDGGRRSSALRLRPGSLCRRRRRGLCKCARHRRSPWSGQRRWRAVLSRGERTTTPWCVCVWGIVPLFSPPSALAEWEGCGEKTGGGQSWEEMNDSEKNDGAASGGRSETRNWPNGAALKRERVALISTPCFCNPGF